MPLPRSERQQVDKLLAPFCAARQHPKRQVAYRIRGNSVTLVELQPSLFKTGEWVEIYVAQFRFDPVRLTWSLYCADRNSRWHSYHESPVAKRLPRLLDAVIADVTGIFWG